ncbi:hypothetical protein ACFTS5_13465 [Nocardia sp. NPDC056952]|uniref:MmyB family transcriptional regulator n=1 Tax=Nocardia sp. NPDC056952 TaxID=3345979 RepID=UPI0036378692
MYTYEAAYLYDLARSARRPSRTRARTKPAALAQPVQLLIDSMDATPVIVHNRCLDVLAANPLGRSRGCGGSAGAVNPEHRASKPGRTW